MKTEQRNSVLHSVVLIKFYKTGFLYIVIELKISLTERENVLWHDSNVKKVCMFEEMSASKLQTMLGDKPTLKKKLILQPFQKYLWD